MSIKFARFAIGESGYTLQLRPMITTNDERTAGLQHVALCLWYKSPNGNIMEIASLSGVKIPRVWYVARDEDDPELEIQSPGARELFELAKRLLTATQEYWNSLNKEDRRELSTLHTRWLGLEAEVEAFQGLMDEMIKKSEPVDAGIEADVADGALVAERIDEDDLVAARS